MTAAGQARRPASCEAPGRVCALEEAYTGQDEYSEDIDARLGQLEIAMEALEQWPLIYDPAEVGFAGAFVTLDRDGSLAIYRGYVRPEDEPREETSVQDGDNADSMGQLRFG
jgi:ParB family chromosome partitioning protein